MHHSHRYNFFSGWGFHIVIAAIALPILGLAYLAWTVLPAPAASKVTPLQHDSVLWTSSDVIAAFQSAGMIAEVVRGETKEERDYLSNLMVLDARRFRISNDNAETGMVLTFKNQRDIEKMQNYYMALNRSLPQFRSWVFVKDNILLQINHEVLESKAREYAEVLYSLDQ